MRRTVLLARVFGFTFAMKKMESGEESAQKTYGRLFAEVPEAERICADEERHEQELLAMLDEEPGCTMWAAWCWGSTTPWWN